MARVRAVGDGSVESAYAWLSRAAEPGHRGLWAYVSEYGAVEVAAQLNSGDGPSALMRAVGPRAGTDRSMADLSAAKVGAIRLIQPEDEEWPADALSAMHVAAARGRDSVVPPLSLWVRGSGRLDSLAHRSVAVVGARAATQYGEAVASDLAADLAGRGWTVVSGGAFGIDAAAHRGALAVGQPTIAVLASGVDRPYPAGNERLFARIAEVGLLVSEWPPGCAPMRQRFLVRNRVIAGLARGTVVVEAALRSGARSTAARTAELGRPVMAVPGPVTSAMSAGILQLLRTDGVLAVGSAAHVLEAVGAIGTDLAGPESGPTTIIDDLEPRRRGVLDAVPLRRPAPTESIAVTAGVGVVEVLAHLAAMEVIGLVDCIDGGWRRART